MADPGWHLARGYRYYGGRCGIRPDPNRKDLALIVSDTPSAVAGVFTQAQITAAPVQVSRTRAPQAHSRGVVVCSGNANACTGAPGLEDAERMASVAAAAIGCRPDQMLVCSTGVIGRALPMQEIEPGIAAAALNLHPTAEALEGAAQAILTTDTRIKVSTQSIAIDGVEIRLTGFAKGAAMIGPNMATMLAFVLTDAKVNPADLQNLLRHAAERTFNCISVEGHTSTNDSLLLFANGAAYDPPSPHLAKGGSQESPPLAKGGSQESPPLGKRESRESPSLGKGGMGGVIDGELRGATLRQYAEAVEGVCDELARSIADDAEGITHLITIHVEGARNDAEARIVAKTVAESALVKTAIFGADPNWGRIVSAAGYAGVAFAESDIACWIGPHLLYDRGTPMPFEAAVVSDYIKANREIDIRLRFPFASGRCRFRTCDLSYEYIRLNAEYTT